MMAEFKSGEPSTERINMDIAEKEVSSMKEVQ